MPSRDWDSIVADLLGVWERHPFDCTCTLYCGPPGNGSIGWLCDEEGCEERRDIGGFCHYHHEQREKNAKANLLAHMPINISRRG